MKKIIIYSLLALLLFRIIIALFGLHFYSIYAEEFFWFILSVLGLSVWYLNLKTTGQIILVITSVISYAVLFIVVMYMTWFLNGYVDNVVPEKLKNLEQKAWMEFHQGSWGGRPYYTVGIGESYLGGLLYSMEAEFEYDYEAPNLNSDKYEIPKAVSNPEECIFWEEKGWLFDFQNKVCYKLKKRKADKLTETEIQWKESMEKKLGASLFLGKGISNIEAIYEKPSTIYLTLNFNDPSFIQAASNEDVEKLSAEIMGSLMEVLNNPDKYDRAYLHFITNDKRDHLYLECDFDYTLEFKYAKYALKKKAVIPNKADLDYVKSIYIPWTNFLRIAYNGRNESQNVFSNSLGCEMHHIRDIGPVEFIGKIKYKGLDCEVYEGKNPDKIKLKNGYLINRFRYLLYKESLVDVTIYYECHPMNSKFTYKEVVDKITYEDKSNKPDRMYYHFVDKNYLTFKYEYEKTSISCLADTSKVPWTIEYNTSITEPVFLYPYAEINADKKSY